MNSKLLAFVVICLAVSLVVLNFGFLTESQIEVPDFFVGISVAYADIDVIKALIDEVSAYTNVFVIGGTGISVFEEKLDEVCKYLVDKDMHFVIYVESHRYLDLVGEVEKRFGDNFLGVYFDDEQGGRQLDKFKYRWVTEADNNTDAADQFVYHLHWWLNIKEFRDTELPYAPSDFRLFTADYALYWFDYLAGYNVVLSEFGWNYSRQINVALNRGAATSPEQGLGRNSRMDLQ